VPVTIIPTSSPMMPVSPAVIHAKVRVMTRPL
jgi:hypothetical protein